jgi:RNA polymerase sigma-70 factor (ECF subfamily)
MSLVRDRAEAEDIVQDAFVTAFLKLESFDAAKSFPAWMRGIIRFKSLEHVRRRREVVLSHEELDLLDEAHRDWDRSAQDDNELFQVLAECLRRLPEILGNPVRMFYLEAMSGAAVAVALACNEATVRKRLQRARGELAVCVNGQLSCMERRGGGRHGR